MTEAERRENARKFYNKWKDRGNEDQDSQIFWIDFLTNIVGMEKVTDRVDFEKKVIVDGHSKKIDVYIPETHILIEQKSINKQLDKKITNSGDIDLTPYEQAKRYNDNLPYDEKARWIITSNFAEIWIYDMNVSVPTPIKVDITELQTKFSLFDFIINKEQKKISQEMEVSVKAGEFVGLIYDAFLKQYINPNSDETLKSLNMLCVRLVFCLYAEDAHIFGTSGHMFHDYLNQFETKDLRKALIELFKILDTPEDKRDPYDTSELSKFPYVNGGLFANEDIEIPNFTEEIRDILLAKASEEFDWSMISPTIFGAVFESTLNPETRRSGGMHYTSIENIHKVIDPLFLDELKTELDGIKTIQVIKTRYDKLKTFQEKLAGLTWLDPACGSGNFLTETYLSIRKLENIVIKEMLSCQKGTSYSSGQLVFGDETTNPIKVNISQFYGIEINDFAVTVAKTALWIAESQMMKETEDIISQDINFLPLKTNANIIEGNSLRIDWNDYISKDKLNYIMGNPPFVGNSRLSDEQKKDRDCLFDNHAGDLDYVCCWYKKASSYIDKTEIQCAFVSTNSICQGQQVLPLWKPLFEEGLIINFAYRTFVWDSEANLKAHVYCIIIGFSKKEKNKKKLYEGLEYREVSHINNYLLPMEDIFIDKRTNPLCKNVPMAIKGFQPTDNGYLLLSEEEKEDFIKKEPNSEKWIRPFITAREFLYRKNRWCLWLVNATPANINSMPLVKERVINCKKWRSEQKESGDAYKLRDIPHMMRQNSKFVEDSFIVVPRVSGERRKYIPFGYVEKGAIPGDSVMIIIGAELYHFGIINSNVHMAWTKVVCGRLKGDYRYSTDIVYNNFPWPEPNEEQKSKIEKAALDILKIREKYKDCSYDDLYDPDLMPIDLLKAHKNNDRAVMNAYGFDIKETSEEKCIEELMKMYKKLTK